MPIIAEKYFNVDILNECSSDLCQFFTFANLNQEETTQVAENKYLSHKPFIQT